jgi:hypothetical protein
MEPFGELHDDLRTGILGSLLTNVWKTRGSPLTPADVMPTLAEAGRAEQTPEEMEAACWRINAMMGGSIEQRG